MLTRWYSGLPYVKPISNDFIFTVKSDNAGTSNSDQFTIPTNTTGNTIGYNYDIVTSDGYTATGVTGNHTITFPSGAGVHTVTISGSFPRIFFNNGGDRRKILELKNFGIYGLGSTNQQGAWWGCSNMTITADDMGHFENVITLFTTWRDCASLTSFPLIDTSNVLNFTQAWNGCSSLTSFPLLNTGNGTNFGGNGQGAWLNCSSLTSFPPIDTSKATSIQGAWQNCSSLTSFPLLDTSNCTNFATSWMNCNSLTSFPLLDTSKGTNFTSTWNNCTSLTSFPLLDTSNGTNFASTWTNCSSLTSFPLLNTGNGTNFSNTWSGCSSLTSFPLLNTGNGTNFIASWRNCHSLTSFPLLDVSKGTNFEATWWACFNLTSFPSLDVSSGITFQSAFRQLVSLTSFPLLNTSSASSSTSNLQGFSAAWLGCSNLESFPANAFDNNFAVMYLNAFFSTKLTTQSIDNILVSLDTSGVNNGTFTQSGGQAPSVGTGRPAIDSLRAKGWTISVTGGY